MQSFAKHIIISNLGRTMQPCILLTFEIIPKLTIRNIVNIIHDAASAFIVHSTQCTVAGLHACTYSCIKDFHPPPSSRIHTMTRITVLS